MTNESTKARTNRIAPIVPQRTRPVTTRSTTAVLVLMVRYTIGVGLLVGTVVDLKGTG